MAYFTYKSLLLIPTLFLIQLSASAKGGAGASAVEGPNFTSFSSKHRSADSKWADLNKEFSRHPDADIYGNVGNNGMVELFGKRTLDSKYYVKTDNSGAFAIEKSNNPVHYNKNGQLLTIDPHLSPLGTGLFEASHQQYPVGIDAQQKASYISMTSGRIYFNKWELLGVKNNISTVLASANWSQYTVGDDGVLIKEIFPGIDAELIVRQGEVKTNFIVHRNNFSGYDALKFRDYIGDATGSLAFAGSGITSGIGEVSYMQGGKALLHIEKGISYVRNHAEKGAHALKYTLSKNELSVNVESTYLNDALTAGDVVIDPRVVVERSLSSAAINAVGSKHCGSLSNFCASTLSLLPPAGATITRIYNKFSVAPIAPLNNSKLFWRVFANTDSTCGYFVTLNSTATAGFGLTDSSGVGVGYGNVTTFFPCISKTGCPPDSIRFTIGLFDTACSVTGASVCGTSYMTASDNFTIKIEGYTLAATPIVRSSNTTICEGASITLSRAGSLGGANVKYSWQPTGDTTASITVSPRVTTLYTSTVTDGCSTFIDTTTVFVANANTLPVFSSPIRLCQFDAPQSLATRVTGTNLKWYANATTNIFTTTAPVPPTNMAPAALTYYVTQNTICGESPRAVVIVVVTEKPAPPTVVSPLRLCQYDTVALSADGQNVKWYLNPTGGGGQSPFYPPTGGVNDSVYYYGTQTVGGCESDRSRLLVTVTYKPNGIIQPTRLALCQGEEDSFYYFGNARPDAVYNWTSPHSETAEVSGAGTSGPYVVRFDSSGTYNVSVQVNNRGCLSDIASQPIVVRPRPALHFVSKEDACVNEIINVALSSRSPLIDSFRYNFADGVIKYGTASGGPYGIVFASAGTKIITNTAFYRGCPSRVTPDTIEVHPLPDARFRITANSGGSTFCNGDSLVLTSLNTDSNTNYVWSPNNFFESGNVYTAKGFLNKSGYISLKLISQWGCVASDSLFVQTENCCKVFFPNAFSPNGDTRNDLFRPISRGNHEVKTFRIINRWGQVVYESKDEKRGWDGTYNGKPQDMGTYYYYLSYYCGDGGGESPRTEMEEKGEVILLR